MEALFPPPFLHLLREVLECTPRIRGGLEQRTRARQRMRAASGTFVGHRAYEPGDDLRLVDWNAYARSGEVLTKLLEDDAPRSLTIVLDRSASMAVGDPERRGGALRYCAILGSLALARLDAVHLVLAGDDQRAFQGLAQRSELLLALEGLAPREVAPVELARAVLERDKAASLCWISDFTEPESYSVPLRMLARHGRACLCLLPLLRLDVAPDEDGWVELHDPETGERQRIAVDAALRRALADELAVLERRRDAAVAGAGAQLLRVQVPEARDFRLLSWWPGSLRSWI